MTIHDHKATKDTENIIANMRVLVVFLPTYTRAVREVRGIWS